MAIQRKYDATTVMEAMTIFMVAYFQCEDEDIIHSVERTLDMLMVLKHEYEFRDGS